MKLLLVLLLLPVSTLAQVIAPSQSELARWKNEAGRVTIIRDHFGIPHIYGKSDADAVFGLLYAQCEDDFPRVEMNYVEKLGRMAEVKGKGELYNDLLIRLVIDSAASVKDYQRAPAWLKKLCNAFADGINYYLYTHPEVKPALLTRFEPWYPMLWTDGSIGAITTADITMNEIRSFFQHPDSDPGTSFEPSTNVSDEKLTGSNGFAFAPRITKSGHAILYINPHVTLYFRPEVHMVSEEGLNAYGAVTWGQFFVYQGFNEHCGWMHTSSYADAADSYIEKISEGKTGTTYLYNNKQLPVKKKTITIRYKGETGLDTKSFTAMFTGHGPILARRNGQYLSLRADNRIMNGLVQCWQRIKARGLDDFKKTLELNGNISNNTVYADADGNIAYWHGNRMPVRDTAFDWSKPVDGTIKATEWRGLTPLDQTIHLYNPPNGWLQNCNSTPFTVAGDNSPKASDYPAYMAPDGENFRGINAVRVLSENTDYTLQKVIRAGYDTRLSFFEVMVPALLKAFDEKVTPDDSLFALLAGPIAVLRKWDYRSGENSIATTLGVEWGSRLMYWIFNTPLPAGMRADQVNRTQYFAAHARASDLLYPLLAAVNDLTNRFGRWQMPWGSINRFQRLSGNLDNVYNDSLPSIPVGFTSSAFGMLPSYTSRSYPGTQKRYGVNGNSFICAVEFGPKVHAVSLLAGGESGHPESPHFTDQAQMYARGIFKEVLFYKDDVVKQAEKTYHPGE